MKWAFWRRDDKVARAKPRGRVEAGAADADAADDSARALRLRTRRRLIGAAALLLAVVILVPMLLDPSPRPLPDDIPIDIPSEKTPFTPRLPLPPVPDPAQLQGGAPPDAAPDEAKQAAPADDAGATGAAKVPPKAPEAEPARAAGKGAAKGTDQGAGKEASAAQAADAERARAILESRGGEPKAAKAGKFLIQAAAPRNEGAARELAARLKKAGLPSFVERVQASDGARWRVRVGPYASRAEAEPVRAKLRELGVGADLIAP